MTGKFILVSEEDARFFMCRFKVNFGKEYCDHADCGRSIVMNETERLDEKGDFFYARILETGEILVSSGFHLLPRVILFHFRYYHKERFMHRSISCNDKFETWTTRRSFEFPNTTLARMREKYHGIFFLI